MTSTQAVEFIGMIGTRDASETRPAAGPVIDPAYTVRFARAHEDAGFDRVLIGYSSTRPDGLQVAAHVAARTERLGLLVAHRPGFIAPTLAARTFATLDHFTEGRVAVHTISGGNDTEQRRDGDYLTKEERYDRTDEYLTVLRRAWSSAEPFSHEGRHYRFEEYGGQVLPFKESGIPLYFGGSSEAAYRVGGKHADTFALWGEPLAETAEQIASVRAAAANAGRATPPGISVSFRPVLAPTEELAWERAHRILDTIKTGAGRPFFDQAKHHDGDGSPQNAGSRRLLAAAAKQDLHDRALWTPTASATGAGGNTTALVGTPETVARALLDYIDIGVTTILIRGFDPLDDAIDYGRYLLPLVRQELAHRAATAAPLTPAGSAR
ncbi:LLM class flavin-dependent oxidoreductase [Streptomyces tsukubensis]|uniref:Alkanesulfonate monooxygenase n=1 Tax=Streptomyces tsukubensis TaxID=83656 RepID=A0A1V4AEP3_9ACTN|nr:LLM class flavin-dependent oxidoreductase [Streptomyces tsukubensis]OON82564.1 alkanesulfonate monooxygenase [Streptomyces tsukubensis]QFR92273.1 LLM class flavin-dependent oxidoreductase [Streptomyces tsukubensis]